MKEKISQTLLIGKAAWAFLKNEQRKQRGLDALASTVEDRLWKNLRKVDGKKQIMDGSYGGGDGSYTGRWTEWSVDEMKAMLDAAGLEYEIGQPVQYISI